MKVSIHITAKPFRSAGTKHHNIAGAKVNSITR